MQLVLCNSPGFIQIFFKSKFSVDDFKRNIIYFKKITPFPWSIFKYRKGDLDPPFENPCFIFLKILVGVSYFNWNRIFFFTLMFFSQVVNNKSSDNLRRICFSLLIISYLRVFLCFFFVCFFLNLKMRRWMCLFITSLLTDLLFSGHVKNIRHVLSELKKHLCLCTVTNHRRLQSLPKNPFRLKEIPGVHPGVSLSLYHSLTVHSAGHTVTNKDVLTRVKILGCASWSKNTNIL